MVSSGDTEKIKFTILRVAAREKRRQHKHELPLRRDSCHNELVIYLLYGRDGWHILSL